MWTSQKHGAVNRPVRSVSFKGDFWIHYDCICFKKKKHRIRSPKDLTPVKHVSRHQMPNLCSKSTSFLRCSPMFSDFATVYPSKITVKSRHIISVIFWLHTLAAAAVAEVHPSVLCQNGDAKNATTSFRGVSSTCCHKIHHGFLVGGRQHCDICKLGKSGKI